MKRCSFLLVPVVLAAVTLPAPGGIFFNRSKPNPAERVPQLLATLKGDKSEHNRASAADELRQFDTANYPEIVPALIDCALHDPEAGVRIDAVQSLGKIRPVSQAAGWALEQVLAHDKSMRVRLQARTSLYSYYVSGYRSNGKGGEPPMVPGEAVKAQELMVAPPPAPLGMVNPPPTLQPMPAGPLPMVAAPVSALKPAPTIMEPPQPAPIPVLTPGQQPAGGEQPVYQPLPTGPATDGPELSLGQ